MRSICERVAARLERSTSWERVNDERKVRLLVYSMTCVTVALMIFIVLNVFHFKLYLLATIECVFLLLCVGTLADLRVNGKLLRASWSSVLITGALTMAVFCTVQANFCAAIWLLVPVIIGFFLLGTRTGSIFGLAYTGITVAVTALRYSAWPALNEAGGAAITNIVAGSITVQLLTYYYESVRRESFSIIERVANTDYLTGVPNRRYFLERLGEKVAEAHRKKTPFAMLIADIDYFKKINDTLGHDAGDRVLADLARLMQNVVRPYDTVGRLGGEEFGLLLSGISGRDALEKAENIRHHIEQHNFEHLGQRIPVTVSMGLVSLSAPSEMSVEQIYKAADLRLYDAKRAGRNRVVVSAPATPATYPVGMVAAT